MAIPMRLRCLPARSARKCRLRPRRFSTTYALPSTIAPGKSGKRFRPHRRSEEHTSELQSLMRKSYAVFSLKKKKKQQTTTTENTNIYYNILHETPVCSTQ